MASSNADLKTKISTLRHEILSYRPGKAVPCDEVVFPDKLVIGVVDLSTYSRNVVRVLRLALHGNAKGGKLADKRQTSIEDQEEYLTDYISVISSNFLGVYKEVDQDFAGKAGCRVLLVEPNVPRDSHQWIKVIKEGTGRVPICAILTIWRREALKRIKNDLNTHGITDIYELAWPDQILSDREQLQWLDLIHGCLQEGDILLAINELKGIKLARRVIERLQTEKEDDRARAEKEKRSLAAEMTKKLESKQHQVDSLTELLEEKERNETSLKQQVVELKIEGEGDRARGEEEKHSLAAEMSKKLESKRHHVHSLTENLREKERNETTLRQQVEELKKEGEEDRARGELEKRSLAAEMSKEIESKQKRVDTLTEIVGERKRNETSLKQQIEELRKEGEEDRMRGEQEKRSLTAEMTKEIESQKQRVDSLTEMLEEKERNETTLRQQVEELKKGREEARARGEQEKHSLTAEITKKLEIKQHRVDSLTEMLEEKKRNETNLRQQMEELKNERKDDIERFEKETRLVEQLERETWKLRTKIQLESEMRSAEQKKKAETPQWMQSLIPWMNSGRQAQSGTSSSEDNSTEGMGRKDTSQAGEEPPDDEFADILKKIAVELYDEDKIDSLGGQLGFLQGDIQRAHMTNMRFNRVTSDGTRHMLNQWRRGVSREDERIELRKALQAAKLVNLAEQFLREDTQIDAEYVNEHADDQQLSTRDETSQEQDQTEGHTDTKVLRGATASNDHTPRDGHTGDMALTTQENLTDGSRTRSQHPDKSPNRSTEKFDASEVASEDVSSGEVNVGDDMTDVSSIQPSEPSSSHEIQVLPEDISEIAPLVSSDEKPNEESTILDKSHVGGIISYGEDLISQLVLIDTFPEKILLLFLLKIAMDVSQKARKL